ncbi:zinc-ribbon domain-containing protein [Butyrivibrio hungatei]|uniref:zinc-ribbon domain-containing protein n=1 Tax=Butyrivibrio hungatei TaxID=185008 RepID=UPI001A9952E6
MVVTPRDVTPNSAMKVYWTCPICNNVWSAKILNRNHGSGCPECYKNSRKKRD